MCEKLLSFLIILMLAPAVGNAAVPATMKIHFDDSLQAYSSIKRWLQLSPSPDSVTLMEDLYIGHTYTSLSTLVRNMNAQGLYIKGIFEGNSDDGKMIYDANGNYLRPPDGIHVYMKAYDPPKDCSDIEHSVVDNKCTHGVSTLAGGELSPNTSDGDCVNAGCRCESGYLPMLAVRDKWLPQVACVNTCDGYGENTIPKGWCGNDWNEKPECVAQYCGCINGYERGTGSNSNKCVKMTKVTIKYECSGGTGTPPETMVVNPGEQFVFPNNTCTPTPHGLFMGWNFFVGPSGRFYPGETYTIEEPGYYTVNSLYSSYADRNCVGVTTNDKGGDCPAAGYRCMTPYIYEVYNGICVPKCEGAETNFDVCTSLSDISPAGTLGGCATLYCKCPDNKKSKNLGKTSRWYEDILRERYTGLCYTE